MKDKEPKLSEAAAIDRLIRAEIKLSLYEHKLDGWSAWPSIRSYVYYSILDLPIKQMWRTTLLDQVMSRMWWLSAAIKDISKLLFIKQADFFIESVTTGRTEKSGQLYKDELFDVISEGMSSFVKMEILNSKLFYERHPALIKPTLTTSLFEACAFIFGEIFRNKQVNSLSHLFSLEIVKEFGLKDFGPARIRRLLMRFLWLTRIYSWLFGRIKPKFILFSGTAEQSLIAAATQNRIKTYQFQHGILHPFHPYLYQNNAENYADILPLPTKLLLFGRYWQENLGGLHLYKNKIISVGKPLVDKYRNLGNLKTRSRASEPTRNILFTSQGLDTIKFAKFIKDFMVLGSKSLDLQVTIKLHPAYENEQDKTYFQSVFINSRGIKVISGSDDSTAAELLLNADVHVSISSMCHYEAITLNVPTIVLQLASWENVKDLVSSGHAIAVSTPAELIKVILEEKLHHLSAKIGNYYFTPNAIHNIRTSL